MTLYVKKNKPVKAFQITNDSYSNIKLWPDWLQERLLFADINMSKVSNKLQACTVDGSVAVNPGDFLINGVELIVVSENDFNLEYEVLTS